MKKKMQNVLIIIVLIVIAFLICMKSPINIVTKNMPESVDSSVFKYIGWSMQQGKVPYLDCFDHKGLLLYFINYIGMIISPIDGVWLIEFVFMFLSLLFTYKLARKFTSKSISLLITTVVFTPIYYYFDKGNLTEEYALPFQIIALNIFFDFFLNAGSHSSKKEKESLLKLDFKWFNIPVCICGICCACVLFLRANMISIWFVFCIMVFLYCIKKKKYHELIKFILSFVCGLIIVILPMIIYLMCNGALQSFIDDYILFNMNYSANTGKIDKLNVVMQFCSNTVVMLAFVIIMIKIYRQVKNKERCYFNWGYLIYMIVTVLVTSMSGKFYNHYGMNLIPVLIYPYCMMYQFIEEQEKKNSVNIRVIVTGYLLITLIIPTGLNFTKDFLNKMLDRGKPLYTNEIIETIKSETQEGELISVFGNSDYIYYLTNRQSASKYSYQLPIVTIDRNRMDEYLNDLETKKPKFIVYDVTNEVENRYKETTQIMKKFLEEKNYKIVKRIGDMLLYVLAEDNMVK